jgi:hypothetical protein
MVGGEAKNLRPIGAGNTPDVVRPLITATDQPSTSGHTGML